MRVRQRKLTGPISASLCQTPPTFAPEKRTSAQLAGLRYEARVLSTVSKLYNQDGTKVVEKPWVVYRTTGRSGLCQPDFLIETADGSTGRPHVIVVEVKLSWIASARSKLVNFYGPIIQALYPNATLSYVQVYKNWRGRPHKRKLSIFNLLDVPKGKYKECHLP